MRAGILKEIVDVYRPTVTTNSLGEQTTAYTKVHTYRARIVHNSRDRENIHGDVTYPNTYNLQVRIYCDIQDYDILKVQDHYYRLTQAPLKNKDLQCQNLTIGQVEGDLNIVTPHENDSQN
jgi:head-tail adaptor